MGTEFIKVDAVVDRQHIAVRWININEIITVEEPNEIFVGGRVWCKGLNNPINLTLASYGKLIQKINTQVL